MRKTAHEPIRASSLHEFMSAPALSAAQKPVSFFVATYLPLSALGTAKSKLATATMNVPIAMPRGLWDLVPMQPMKIPAATQARSYMLAMRPDWLLERRNWSSNDVTLDG